MFLTIFLCSLVIVVASANNVIPAQTYPIYQQNGYMNPQANLPSNIQPYLQNGKAQNQLQQLNISPSSIKQALLNRLLTNQPRQAISDSNARSYSPNLNVVQNNHVPANLANNYVVVPRDYLMNNTSYLNIDTNTNRNNTKKGKQSKKRSKVQRQSDVEKIESSLNQNKSGQLNSNNSTKNTKIVENTTENNKPSRKNTRKQNSQVTDTTERTTSNKENENNNKRTGRRKKKQKEEVTTTTESPIKEENEVQNTKPQKRRKKQKVTENSEPESEVVAVKSKPKEIGNVDLDITKEGMNNENRLARNSKQETNDLLKSIPNTPKEITNHFLTNLSQFNNPMMGNWFANYENLFQSLANQSAVSQVNEIKPKRRRKSRKNKKSKRKNTQNRNVTEDTSKVNSFDINSTTTERSIAVDERAQTYVNSSPTEDSPKSFENRDLSSNEIFRDGYNINEFEDRYNTGRYEGYIDDYYPLFTDNAAYTANNKEIILKNLNDNKYYYATDIIDSELRNKHHDHNGERSHMFNAYEKNKHTYDEIERESIRNAYKKEFDDKFEEKLQFRSPPHLESPDFRTRQIDKSELKPEVYYVYDNNHIRAIEDKSSSYSTAKTPYSSGAKRNEIKTRPKDVETVYVKSKVVSYGPVYTPTEDSSTAANQISWSDYDISGDTNRSGDTTYVVAKSLGHPESYMQRD